MKILLTGGGSGGHFYPIIAVAQSINKIAKEEKLVNVQLFYAAPQPYDKRALYENNITYVQNSAGKIRRYFSLLNIIDVGKTLWGIFQAVWTLYIMYPDVVFGKGGYVSFPVLWAARFLRIPVIIHESDSKPGRANMWAGKFARKIAISYPDAAHYFKNDKVAYTGNPIRLDIIHPAKDGAREFLNLEENIPVILILGGSLGAQAINENLVDALPKLVERYQIIHQTGATHFNIVKNTAEVVLQKSEFKKRYKPYEHLDNLTLRMAAGVSDLIISRAGSTIFEIALWGVPSIIIPIPPTISHDQTSNAYSYARTGAAVVIEQTNLTGHILISEIDRLMNNHELRASMSKAAASFARTDAADLIAHELIAIGLEHEK